MMGVRLKVVQMIKRNEAGKKSRVAAAVAAAPEAITLVAVSVAVTALPWDPIHGGTVHSRVGSSGRIDEAWVLRYLSNYLLPTAQGTSRQWT